MTTEPTASINEDLIKQYFEAGDLNNLITLFHHLRLCALRAEALSSLYQHQMFELHKRLDASRANTDVIREPRPKRIIESPAEPKVAKRAPRGTAVDIDL